MFYARLVRSNRLVKSNKMQQDVAETGWELTKVARIGRSRSVYGQKRVEGGVGQSREPKLSVCCLRISAHPFLAKNRPGATVFGHCPLSSPARAQSRVEFVELRGGMPFNCQGDVRGVTGITSMNQAGTRYQALYTRAQHICTSIYGTYRYPAHL